MRRDDIFCMLAVDDVWTYQLVCYDAMHEFGRVGRGCDQVGGLAS